MNQITRGHTNHRAGASHHRSKLTSEQLAKAYKQNWNDQYPDLVKQAEEVIALAKAGTPSYDGEEFEI